MILSTGVAWSQGGCLVSGHAWSGEGGSLETPSGMATAVGSTHPIGMHSCCKFTFNGECTYDKIYLCRPGSRLY